jgi:orsellinic acid C2-O-methyltransferase
MTTMAMMDGSETGDRGCPGRAPSLVALVQSASLSQVACVAAELRIADLLASGPKDAGELARATGTHGPSLHRLLRALASLELCTERDDGSFTLSPMSSLLRTDTPDSLRSWLLWCCRYQWSGWGNLLYSVKTGNSARELATGADGFGHLQRDPQAAAIFNQAMVEMTRLVADEVMRNYDFSDMRRIVDVGGGHGALLAAVLKANSALRGVVFDLPHAIEGARKYLTEKGVADRCDLVTGDFFEQIPDGADAYLLKNIIHDWNDERSSRILRSCRDAMRPNGKLLLIERIMPERVEASSLHRAIVWADLIMMLGPGGHQRTEAEFLTLLDSSGFRLTRIIETEMEYSLIEAVPC